MKISEKQTMQLMNIAQNYVHKIELMISYGIAHGSPDIIRDDINRILFNIRDQQSEELKDITDSYMGSEC